MIVVDCFATVAHVAVVRATDHEGPHFTNLTNLTNLAIYNSLNGG